MGVDCGEACRQSSLELVGAPLLPAAPFMMANF